MAILANEIRMYLTPSRQAIIKLTFVYDNNNFMRVNLNLNSNDEKVIEIINC